MRLYAKMGENTKQVRVDNWGIFFLQRLQMFFSKTDYCDMTLQFEGNVQLKVHRLVMNACTEYFQFLEQTCTMDDNVIMMPADLQADVIVPIVNFMYTGMLEFHLSIFDKLYKTAQVMNITILTKLLDAQKQPGSGGVKAVKKKPPAMAEGPPSFKVQVPAKTSTPKVNTHGSDLPAMLPGRKVPVWKRKSVPQSAQPYSHGASPLCYPDTKWTPSLDPLSIPDNTPKPTRFEWPEDDLPTLPLMETSFEDISYNSKPLLTQEEDVRAGTSFDDVKHLPSGSSRSTKKQAASSTNVDMEEMKDYVKEQKIRSGMSSVQDEEMADNDLDYDPSQSGGTKRKMEQKSKTPAKKVRFDNSDGRGTTISVTSDGKSDGELSPSKIVTEILKKYPQIVKKNKNIRLKIMTKNKSGGMEQSRVENIQIKAPKMKVQVAESPKPEPANIKTRDADAPKSDDKGPWSCQWCSTEDEPVEFVLYYLYRKHMTDVHNEKFDSKLCKYCGQRCSKHNLLMYHLYTKHGMKPPPAYTFPKCNQCPYIALSHNILNKHKMRHGKNEIQCLECKLTFTSQATLTSHMQITGHTGKKNKNSYDCQYCTKRYQSGANLFSHVRLQHRNEAIRDGIVSVDEVDDVDEIEELEEDGKEEYILPEIISESEPPKKVNILSNVKVQDRLEHHNQRTIPQTVPLEPSSEAEALNNVATGIATSLGLVDIVVLNDNQQLFLQPEDHRQQNYVNQQGDQPEFILPELTGREDFVQDQNEVITTDIDIGSTDELVMVLTDHDYGDNQEEISSDNSNIVVLYSHPVDGQQDQFITSQGNIMVNSQTGMIEIRNGATITTSTANQVVMHPQENQVESIEMIQREIESHGDLKTDPLYEEDRKPAAELDQKEKGDAPNEEEQQPREAEGSPKETESLEPTATDESPKAVEEGRQEEQQEPMEHEENPENVEPEIAEPEIAEPEIAEPEIAEPEIADPVSAEKMDDVDNSETNENVFTKEPNDELSSVPDDFVDIGETEKAYSETEPTPQVATKSGGADVDETAANEEEEEGSGEVEGTEATNSEEQQPPEDEPPEEEPSSEDPPSGDQPEPSEPAPETTETVTEKDREPTPVDISRTPLEDNEENVQEEQHAEDREEDDKGGAAEVENKDPLEVPQSEEVAKVDAEPSTETTSNRENSEEFCDDAVEDQEAESLEEEEEEEHHESQLPQTETGDEGDQQLPQDDTSLSKDNSLQELEEPPPSDTSTSQFNDDNSRSSQGSQDSPDHQPPQRSKQTERTNHNAKILILDDWDDTDSQQSSDQQKEKAKLVGETVNKLMDDWEEEEEDDGRK